jgi:hypothetical protein
MPGAGIIDHLRWHLGRVLSCQFSDDQIYYIRNPYINNLMNRKDGKFNTLDLIHSRQLIIVDCSNEHWGLDGGVIETIRQEFLRLDSNFLILTHCPEQHDPELGILYYPYYYYFSKSLFEIQPVKNKKQFSLGCLNGSPRPHRIANYYVLQNKKYWDNCCVSFFNADPMPWRHDDVTLELSEIQFWNAIKQKLPENKNFAGMYDINLSPVTESYVNLVTETTVIDKIFISEKTWKPVAAGQIFLIFGIRITQKQKELGRLHC